MRYVQITIALATLALSLAGCNKKEPEKKAAPSSSSAKAETSQPAKPPPPTPEDIDLSEIDKALHCPKGDKAVCKVLEGFRKAKRWNFVTIRSGEGRYFGRLWQRKGGKTTPEWGMLFIKRVPLNQVEPGDLPVRLALRQLDPKLGPENRTAPKLLRLLEAGHAVNKNRVPAATYVLKYAVAQWYTAGPSKGASIIVDLQQETYMREGARREIYVVQPASARPGSRPDDGLYGILYPLSW